MYKVFFNDRVVSISGEHKKLSSDPGRQIVQYHDRKELGNILQSFILNHRVQGLTIEHPDINKAWEDFQSWFKVIHAAGGVVENTSKKLLVIHRLGKPDLPKGKVEKGETPEDGAIREVQEECGLHDVELIAPITTTYHTYELNGKWILKHTHWFKMRYMGNVKPTPQVKEDIRKTRWVEKEEIKKIMKFTYASIKDVLISGQYWGEAGSK